MTSYTQASDVYSLSTVLWEVLTGSLPWSHLSHSELRHAVVTRGRRLDLCNPLISAKLAAELKECFKEPSDRPTSQEVREHVGDVFGHAIVLVPILIYTYSIYLLIEVTVVVLRNEE